MPTRDQIIRMGDQRKIYIDGNSKLLANGTKDKPITIEPDPNVNAWAGVVVNSGSATFNYTHFKNLFKQLYDKPIFTGGIYNNCWFYLLRWAQSYVISQSYLLRGDVQLSSLRYEAQHNEKSPHRRTKCLANKTLKHVNIYMFIKHLR